MWFQNYLVCGFDDLCLQFATISFQLGFLFTLTSGVATWKLFTISQAVRLIAACKHKTGTWQTRFLGCYLTYDLA
jgi:hypothetical protein